MTQLRTVLVAACALLVAAGCSGPHHPTQPSAPGVPSGPAAGASLDPATTAACTRARGVIDAHTDRFTAQLQTAAAALNRDDAAAAERATAAIRATFRDWAAALRRLATAQPEARMQLLFVEYAGAVDAVIARIRTPDDLDRLYTFTEGELDVMASRFAELCS